MAVRKKQTLKEFKKAFEGTDLVRTITEAITAPTSHILYLMTCDDDDNEEPIINMAVARAVYLAYTEGDIKRLDWLLSKIGIKDVEEKKDQGIDLSKLNNETIIRALKPEGNGNATKKR